MIHTRIYAVGRSYPSSTLRMLRDDGGSIAGSFITCIMCAADSIVEIDRLEVAKDGGLADFLR